MTVEMQCVGVVLVEVEDEQGLMSNQTHYRSYRGRVFTGQMTKSTVSKH